MRHRVADKKLGRTYEHKKALLSNMAISLFRYERIETTLVKAKLLRVKAERMITWAKRGGLANIRLLEGALLHNKDTVGKLIKVIAPRYKDRNGGYTRIMKLRNRKGDNALIAIIELVDRVKREKKVKKEGKEVAAVEAKGAKKEEGAKK